MLKLDKYGSKLYGKETCIIHGGKDVKKRFKQIIFATM